MNDVERDRMRAFGDWLTPQVRRLGISDRKFAVLVGVTPTTPRTWMLGSSLPSYTSCVAIAKALGLTPAEVMRAAGYQIEDAQGRPVAPIVEDDDALAELIALWPQLQPPGRVALLSTARALLDSAPA